jgi:hypothetical protein
MPAPTCKGTSCRWPCLRWASAVHSVSASSPAATSAASSAGKSTTKRLSLAEIAERRRKGQCFKCEELYTQGHRDVCKQLYTIEVIFDPDDIAPPAVSTEMEPTILLHTLTGIQPRAGRTMQLLVLVNGVRFTTLLDSSSTHNFMGMGAAQRATIELCGCVGFRVAVANGGRITSPDSCQDLQIKVGDEVFSIDCYGISLGSYDMVLGVHWLESLGPILCDFGCRTIAFVRDRQHVLWSASEPGDSQSTLLATSSDLMEELLLQFHQVFAEPTGLPPARGRVHRIRLQPGTPSVAVCPYRYTQDQKLELEHQCAGMLQQGVIHPSSSAFSVPVLLVKKHDGAW